jgi:hypothetical protein
MAKCVLCPIMTKTPGEWSSRVTGCDIPETRERWILETTSECTDGDTCFPQMKQMIDATKERMARMKKGLL